MKLDTGFITQYIIESPWAQAGVREWNATVPSVTFITGARRNLNLSTQKIEPVFNGVEAFHSRESKRKKARLALNSISL